MKWVSNFLKLTSTILTIWLISLWICIITEKSIELDETGKVVEGSIFEILYLIKGNLDTYSTIWSINALWLFIIFIKQLNFSSSLSLFNEVIKRITFDTIFFIIMFMNIIIVLSLIMNILFGTTDSKFKNFSYSMLNSFLLSLGENSSLKIVTFSTIR